MALAGPLSVFDSLARPVPEALNANRPRGPPASWVCSSMSSFDRHSPPTLTVCDASSRVNVEVKFQVFSDRSHGWLAENPRSGSPWLPTMI